MRRANRHRGGLFFVPTHIAQIITGGGAPAPARDYFFAATGNDTTGNGSQGTPYATITKALSLSLNPGDRLLFKGGDTFNDALLTVPASNITVTSWGTGRGIISATTTEAIVFSGHANVVIDNLDVRSTSEIAIRSDDASGSANASVQNCVISSTGASALQTGVLDSGWLIQDNTIQNCGNHAVVLQGGPTHTVTGNAFSNNADGVAGGHDLYVHATGTSWAQSIAISDNTFSTVALGSAISLRRAFARCWNNTITVTGAGLGGITYFDETPVEEAGGTTWIYNNLVKGTPAGGAGIYVGMANTDAGGTTTLTNFVVLNNTVVGAGADACYDFSAEAVDETYTFPTNIVFRNNGCSGTFTAAFNGYPASDGVTFDSDFNGWWSTAGDIQGAAYFKWAKTAYDYATWASLPEMVANENGSRVTDSELQVSGFPANTSDWVDGGTATSNDSNVTYGAAGSGALLVFAGTAPDIGATTGDQVFVLSVPTNVTPGALSPTGPQALGVQLTATRGVWVRVPSAWKYEWLSDSSSVVRDSGFITAASDSYTIQTADAGHTITCRVTAQNAAGNSAPSNLTGSAAAAIPGGGTAVDPTTLTGLTANQLTDMSRELAYDGSGKARSAFPSAWTVGALEVSPGATKAGWQPTAANGWGADAVFLRTKFVAPIAADGGTLPAGWSRATGAGTGDSKSDPWTLLQAKRNYIAGDDIRICGGAYHAFKLSDGTNYGSPAVASDTPINIDRGNAVATASTFGTLTNPVRFRADDPANKPKIKWLSTTKTDDIFKVTQSYVILDGLELDGNAAASPTFPGGVAVQSQGTLSDGTHFTHIAVVNCYMHHSKNNGVELEQTDYCRIDNNTVWLCGPTGTSVPSGISINLKGVTFTADGYDGFHNYIVNNIVGGSEGAATDGNGIILDNGGGSPDITAPSTLIANNVCYWNGNRGIHIYKWDGSHVVVNNTLHTNGLDETSTEPAAGTAGECSQVSGTATWCNNLVVPWQGSGSLGTVPFRAEVTPTITCVNNWFEAGRHANSTEFTASELRGVTTLAITSTVPDNVTSRQERNAPAPDREKFRPSAQPLSVPDTIVVDGSTPVGTGSTKLVALAPPQGYLRGISKGSGFSTGLTRAAALDGALFTGGHATHMTGSTFQLIDQHPSTAPDVYNYAYVSGSNVGLYDNGGTNFWMPKTAFSNAEAQGAAQDRTLIAFGCDAWMTDGNVSHLPNPSHIENWIDGLCDALIAGYTRNGNNPYWTAVGVFNEWNTKTRVDMTGPPAGWLADGLPTNWETQGEAVNPDTYTPAPSGIAYNDTNFLQFGVYHYTKVYNRVWDRLKGHAHVACNSVKIVGPHMSFGALDNETNHLFPLGSEDGTTVAPYDTDYHNFLYWLKFAHGIDRITIDYSIVSFGSSGGTGTDVNANPAYVKTNHDAWGRLIRRVQWYRDNYAMSSAGTSGTNLTAKRAAPVDAIEFYYDVNLLRVDAGHGVASALAEDVQAMQEAMVLRQLWLNGIGRAYKWQPQGDTSGTNWTNKASYFRSTIVDGTTTTNKASGNLTTSQAGGKFLAYDVAKQFVDNFSDGSTLYDVTSFDPDLVCMATATRLLVINTNTTTNKTFTVQGASQTLNAKKVAVYPITVDTSGSGGGTGGTIDPATLEPGSPADWETNWRASLTTYNPDNPFGPTQLYYDNATTAVISGGLPRNVRRGTAVDTGGNRYTYYPRSLGFDITAIDFSDPTHLKVTTTTGHDITVGATIAVNDTTGRTDLKPDGSGGFTTTGQSLKPILDRVATVTAVSGNVITLSSGWTPSGTYGAWNDPDAPAGTVKNSGKYDDRDGHKGYISKHLMSDDYHEVIVTQNNIATAGDTDTLGNPQPYFTADGTLTGARTAGPDGFWVWTGGYTEKWSITGNSPGSLKVRIPGNLDVKNASAEFVANGPDGDPNLFSPFNSVEWTNCTVDVVGGMSCQATTGGAMAYSQSLGGKYLTQGESISYSGVSGQFEGVLNVGVPYDANKAGSTCQTLRWTRCSNWRNAGAILSGGHTDCYQIFWLDNSELPAGVATWEWCIHNSGGNGMIFLNAADAGKSGAVIANCTARYCMAWNGNKFLDLALCSDSGAEFCWINDDDATENRPDPLDFGNGPPNHPYPTGTVLWPANDQPNANIAVAADGSMSTTATHVQRATIPTGATFVYANS